MLLAFGYAILVAIILPIPIEIALVKPLVDQNFGFLFGTGLAIAAGKTVGAWLIFILGLNIALMSDTIPIYVYSVFNAEGKALERNMFLLANFLAALNRVAILGAIWFLAKPFFPV